MTKGEWNVRFSVLIILTLLMAAIWGCAAPSAPPPAPPAPPVVPPEEVVSILEPSEASLVPQDILVTGILSEFPPYSNIWLIVVPPNNLFYPQWPPPTVYTVGDETTWEGRALLGQPEEVGMQFSVFAVVADPQADKTLRDYVRRCEETGDWPGLPSLPPGANVYYDLITVTRGTAWPEL